MESISNAGRQEFRNRAAGWGAVRKAEKEVKVFYTRREHARRL